MVRWTPRVLTVGADALCNWCLDTEQDVTWVAPGWPNVLGDQSGPELRCWLITDGGVRGHHRAVAGALILYSETDLDNVLGTVAVQSYVSSGVLYRTYIVTMRSKYSPSMPEAPTPSWNAEAEALQVGLGLFSNLGGGRGGPVSAPSRTRYGSELLWA